MGPGVWRAIGVAAAGAVAAAVALVAAYASSPELVLEMDRDAPQVTSGIWLSRTSPPQPQINGANRQETAGDARELEHPDRQALEVVHGPAFLTCASVKILDWFGRGVGAGSNEDSHSHASTRISARLSRLSR